MTREQLPQELPMEEQGIIGAADGSRPREVLVSSLDDVFGGALPMTSPPVSPSKMTAKLS